MGLALAALLAGGLASAPEKGSESPLVVRLGVELVQIDVVVTDGKGHPVTNLRAEDFEIRQDGRPQVVSHVAYVGARPSRAEDPNAAEPEAGREPAPSPESMETLVFVVDDLALSLTSVDTTTRALLRFAEGMEPEDRVFLLRTGRRVVDLRPVEGPAELRAVARSLRPTPVASDLREEVGRWSARALGLQALATNEYLSGLLAQQSLLSLENITDALRGFKGRKTVVLFSEGYPIWSPRQRDVLAPLDVVYGRGEVLDAVDRLTDLANRASVVIHTIDPRGLVPAGISASDSVPNPSADAMVGLLQERRGALRTSQESLLYVAERTGGLAVANRNDVDAGVAHILAASRAYYLVGYEPERATFGEERPRFHSLEVKVKRRGLKVRARKGFYGVSDEALAALAPPQAF